MIVEDLWKAGLSVRAISAGTGIPVGSEPSQQWVLQTRAFNSVCWAGAAVVEKLIG
jgi:hypothetical protein